jgi:hypothetical protein
MGRISQFVLRRRVGLAILAGLAAGASVLVINTNARHVTAMRYVQLATADPTCSYLQCISNGITPTASSGAYTGDQMSWIRSYAFAKAVSKTRPLIGLSPTELWHSVTVTPLGATGRADVTVDTPHQLLSRKILRRYLGVYVGWSKKRDITALQALLNHSSDLSGSDRKTMRAVIHAARWKKGYSPYASQWSDRVTGAKMPAAKTFVAVSGGSSRRHTVELVLAAAFAGAMIVLGGFGLADARRRRSSAEPGGPAQAAAQRPTLS